MQAEPGGDNGKTTKETENGMTEVTPFLFSSIGFCAFRKVYCATAEKGVLASQKLAEVCEEIAP